MMSMAMSVAMISKSIMVTNIMMNGVMMISSARIHMFFCSVIEWYAIFCFSEGCNFVGCTVVTGIFGSPGGCCDVICLMSCSTSFFVSGLFSSSFSLIFSSRCFNVFSIAAKAS